jgi:hypothetical protein
MAWFYGLPAWFGLLLVIAATALVACAGHIAVHRSFPKTPFHEHNEVAGFIVAVAGVLYAVLLAFVTVIVWQHFGDTEDRAASEADAAVDVWRLSRHLPPAPAKRLQVDLAHYVTVIIHDEWPRMRAGESSAEAQRAIIAVLDDVAGVRPRDFQEAIVQNRVLERVQVMADLRRRRINDNGTGIPLVLWASLVIGGAVVFGFIYLFGLRNFRLQLGMTAALAVLIGAALGVILELDYPFRGEISVSPERWVVLQHEMARALSGRSA